MTSERTRLTVTVQEAGQMLGISRPCAYRLVHEGTIPTLRLGRRLVVPKVAIEKMLNGAGRPG